VETLGLRLFILGGMNMYTPDEAGKEMLNNCCAPLPMFMPYVNEMNNQILALITTNLLLMQRIEDLQEQIRILNLYIRNGNTFLKEDSTDE
jgi:hypothetical protein